MATPEMTSSRTWGGFFDPYCGGGARWRPFRFRSPSWMTSFAESEMRSSKMATGSGRAAILRRRRNRGRKTRPILLAPFRRRHFKGIFVCEHELISHRNSVKCVIKVRINNIPALVQIMAWSDKWWLLY